MTAPAVRTVALYERQSNQPGHAWKLARITNAEAADLARSVNLGFGVESLIVNIQPGGMPEFLDSGTTAS